MTWKQVCSGVKMKTKTSRRPRELQLCLLGCGMHIFLPSAQESIIPPVLSDDTLWESISSRVVEGSFTVENSA